MGAKRKESQSEGLSMVSIRFRRNSSILKEFLSESISFYWISKEFLSESIGAKRQDSQSECQSEGSSMVSNRFRRKSSILKEFLSESIGAKRQDSQSEGQSEGSRMLF